MSWKVVGPILYRLYLDARASHLASEGSVPPVSEMPVPNPVRIAQDQVARLFFQDKQKGAKWQALVTLLDALVPPAELPEPASRKIKGKP